MLEGWMLLQVALFGREQWCVSPISTLVYTLLSVCLSIWLSYLACTWTDLSGENSCWLVSLWHVVFIQTDHPGCSSNAASLYVAPGWLDSHVVGHSTHDWMVTGSNPGRTMLLCNNLKGKLFTPTCLAGHSDLAVAYLTAVWETTVNVSKISHGFIGWSSCYFFHFYQSIYHCRHIDAFYRVI